MGQRQIAVLKALMHRSGIFREEIDAIAGASNGPDLIRCLRLQGLGDELRCDRVHAVDRWGQPVRPGFYSLTPTGKAIAARWLEGVNHVFQPRQRAKP